MMRRENIKRGYGEFEASFEFFIEVGIEVVELFLSIEHKEK